jgi:exodeoxyribonuclease V alpha subunit
MDVIEGMLAAFRRGRGTVLTSAREEVRILAEPETVLGVRLYGRYRFAGRYLPDGAFKVEGVSPAEYRRSDYEILAEHGLALAAGEIAALVAGAGKKSLIEYVQMWAGDDETKEEAARVLAQVVGPERAKTLAKVLAALAASREMAELAALLPEYDEPDLLKIRDFLRHRARLKGVSVPELLKQDPYHLLHVPELSGTREMALRVADRLAETFGAPVLGRTAGMVAMYLWNQSEQGHTYCPRAKAAGFLLQKSGRKDWKYEQASEALSSVLPQIGRANPWPYSFFAWEARALDPDREEKGTRVYLAGVYFSERQAAKELAGILTAPPARPVDPEALARAALKSALVPLAKEQVEFVRAVATNKVVLLDGEAGTGKSEALAALAKAWRELTGRPPAVVAPTAIAAMRLAEKCGIDAGLTIHRFADIDRAAEDLALDYRTVRRASGKNEVEKWDVPLVLADEMSMADIVMFGRLAWRLVPECRLVLAGDSGQLPPVGPGAVFRELLALAGEGLPDLARVTLATPWRQEVRALLDFAREVRRGRFPEPDGRFVRLVETEPEKVAEQAADQAERLWREEGHALVLTPLAMGDRRYRSGVGAALLNRELKARLNPAEPLLGTEFSPGDPVLAVANDYEQESPFRAPRGTVFNGMTGTVLGAAELEDGQQALAVDFGGRRALYYPTETGKWLAPAYALTVHKAQGAGADHVVVAASHAGSWARDLLYTAVTRAGKSVTLVGPREVFEKLAEAEPVRRRSTFAGRLRRELKHEAETFRPAAEAPEVLPYIAAAAEEE